MGEPTKIQMGSVPNSAKCVGYEPFYKVGPVIYSPNSFFTHFKEINRYQIEKYNKIFDDYYFIFIDGGILLY